MLVLVTHAGPPPFTCVCALLARLCLWLPAPGYFIVLTPPHPVQVLSPHNNWFSVGICPLILLGTGFPHWVVPPKNALISLLDWISHPWFPLHIDISYGLRTPHAGLPNPPCLPPWKVEWLNQLCVTCWCTTKHNLSFLSSMKKMHITSMSALKAVEGRFAWNIENNAWTQMLIFMVIQGLDTCPFWREKGKFVKPVWRNCVQPLMFVLGR